MTDLTKLLFASAIAGTLALSGCGNESGTPDAESHSDQGDHEGHDHDEDGHEDHDHTDGEHDEHASERSLGSLTIASTTLRVTMGGDFEPSAVLHLDIEKTDGPEPDAIRVWIGNEAATGVLKSKATGSGGDYHADAEVPAEVMPEAALWIEIETSDGSRQVGSISIN